MNPWLSRRVVGFAHQGGACEGPPGTVEAMQKALDHGAAALEFDLHLSSDPLLVIHHDRDVTAGGRSLSIAGHTLAELRAILPNLATLDDVLTAFPNTPMTVEIKVRKAAKPAATRLASEVGARPLIVTSFSIGTVSVVRRTAPKLDTAPGWPIILLFWLASRFRLSFPLRRGHVALQPPLGLWGVKYARLIPLLRRLKVTDKWLVDAARRRGLAVHVWTLNTEADMKAAVAAGAHGIFTDRPSALTKVLDEADLRWTGD
jgi:glycerophosphoryl diester phosphodiesterase